MIDAEKILEELRCRWQSGQTQASIAKAAGISQAYLCDLISGKNDAYGLTIKKINKLFPNAELSLGNRTIGSRNKISNSRIQSDDNFFYGSEKLDEVAQAVMSSEKLSAESKVEVYNIIQKLKK